VEVQWNNIKKCVLDTISDLVGKYERRARKPWITQEMISKMDERRTWKKVNNEEGKKNYRRLRNKFKTATDKAKKEYLESICDEIMDINIIYIINNILNVYYINNNIINIINIYNGSETSIANLGELYYRVL
jgi:hypothetical protein